MQDRHEALCEARAPYFACNELQGFKCASSLLLLDVLATEAFKSQFKTVETRGYNRDDLMNHFAAARQAPAKPASVEATLLSARLVAILASWSVL